MIERSEVESLLAEPLELIDSEELRRLTVDAWMLALKRGGWQSMAVLKKMPFTLLTNCRGLSFIEHTLAVTLGAAGLARGQMQAYDEMPYQIDMDRLIAGGLLHDVGKLLEIQPAEDGSHFKGRNGMCTRHPISGTVIAAEAGLPDELLNVIACHAKEGDGRPQVVETVLIHQADFATFNPLVMMTKGTLIE